MKAAVKQSAMPTSPTANQDFTDAVFSSDVKAGIVFLSRGTVSNTITEQGGISAGFIDSSANQFNIALHDDDANVTTQDPRATLTSGQIASLEDAATSTSLAEGVGSILSSGVRVAWSDWNANELVSTLILGGSDVESSVVTGTLNGTTDVTVAHGLSAAPHIIVAATHMHTAAADNTNGRASIGFYDVAANAYRCVTTYRNTTTSALCRQAIVTTAIAADHGASAFNWKATMTSVDGTNIVFKADAATTDLIKFWCLRITGGTYKLQDFLTKTTTGTQADFTGMSAKPKVVIYLPTYLTSSDALDAVITAGTNEAFGIGVAADNEGVTEQASVSIWSDTLTVGTTDTKSLTSANKAAVILNTAGGLGVDFSVDSWDSGGITNNYSTVSGTARRVVGLAMAPASGPTVTDVDTDESITGTQANVVVTGTGFGASQGAGHVKVFDGSLSVTPTIDTWAATSIQFDMSIGTSTGIRYGSRTLRVTDNAGAFDEQAITVTAPSGKNYVDLTTLADPADRLTTNPDMESGDQLEWSNVVGTGMTIADVTVYADGSFSFTDGVDSFDFRVHDVTTGWGAAATVTTAGLVPTITTTTLPNGTDGVLYSNIISVTGDVPITHALLSGSLPNGLTLSSEGEISGIPTLPGVYSFTDRATNDFGTDDQALSLTIAAAGVTGALASPRKVVFKLSSVSGLVQWVDYWPVKVVGFTEGSAGRYDAEGCVAVRPLASSSGLVAWVDYIPVYDTGTARSRYDNDGFIPVDTLTP